MSSSYDLRYLRILHQIRSRELEAILAVIDKKYLKRVLELGCGDGFQSEILRARCQFLVSLDYRMHAIPPQLSKRLVFIASDVENLPLMASSFNMIFSSNLLEHIEGIDKAFAEMKAALKPEGIMVHSVPNATWKIVQVVLYYPFLVFLKVFAWRDDGRTKGDKSEKTTIRFDSNVKHMNANRSFVQRFVAKLFPRTHGLSRTHIEEIYKFSDCYWRQVFKRNGLAVTARIRMPFYSPYGFGFGRLRKVCEFFRLSSSNCYILTVARKIS